MQRIVHCILTGPDLHDAPAKARDVINRRLQRSIIGANDIGVAQADNHSRPLLHFRMHRARKLPFVRRR